jgi:glycosyltransferase involved in cell wall biosynthesis
MQEKPLITIILPCYNSELTVARCIESILHQTYTNFELLVINDGSTDLTEEIVNACCADDERVKIFSKDNGGVSSARNVGLDNAIGEWVTFVDSDDFVTPHWLDNFVGLISPDVDLVGQGFQTDRHYMPTKPRNN